jgi:hypothetical protein
MEGEGMKFYADGKKSQGKFENSVENGWIKQVLMILPSHLSISYFYCFSQFRVGRTVITTLDT